MVNFGQKKTALFERFVFFSKPQVSDFEKFGKSLALEVVLIDGELFEPD